tara:strand:- start:12596 stop:13237 length:642 start_codon:yes stop_codon:yes gene_type:complete
MSNYNLSLTGAQVNSALNKVHNADTSPTDGSTNMVTSNAVHSAVNDIQFANLASSLINNDMTAGTSGNTLPTSAAVSSFVAATPANFVYGKCDVDLNEKDPSRDATIGDVTGWGNITNSSLISVSGKDITLSAGTYLLLLIAKKINRRYSSGNVGIFRFYKDGSQIGVKTVPDPSSRPTDLTLGGIYGGGVYHCHIDDQYLQGVILFNAIKLA